MRQLVELHKYSAEFKKLNTELVFVFREEAEGVKGLQKIKDKTGTGYVLSVDPNKASTKSYSPGRLVFDNYVINKNGNIQAIIPGTLRTRATAEQLLKHLKSIEAK